MKAAVLHRLGEPLSIEDVDLAEPAAGEVLIDVAAAGLCHSDLHYMEGTYSTELPAVLGHESAGVVAAVGRDVSEVAPGDHVITSLSVFCGSCPYCRADTPYLCARREATQRQPGQPARLSRDGQQLHQFLNLSSFAERMLVHENAVVKIDPAMPLDRAALLGCGVATGLGAVLNTAGVRPGQTVAVIGCGGVGLSAIQGARLAGASVIAAVDVVPAKLELAAKFGATHLVDSSNQDPTEAVQQLTDGLGVDHAIEAIGTLTTARAAFSMLKRGGTATIVGLVPAGLTLDVPVDDLLWGKGIQGSVMGSNRFKVDTPRYVEMYLDGRLDLDTLVTQRLALDQINQGFAAMRSGEGARSLVIFEPSA